MAKKVRTKLTKKTKKQSINLLRVIIPRIGETVMVYGGGMYSTEFEDGTEAEVIDISGELVQLEFDDGHIDTFHVNQLFNIYKRVGLGAMG